MTRTTLLSGAAALALSATGAAAQNACTTGNTIEDGVLTIATGNPAYYPWVMNDDPESKEGFEAAVAYAVANEMGYSDDQVVWTRSSFDQAIQPGAKNYDFNLQQFSITEARDEVIDFSVPYYSAAAAVLTRQPTADAGATNSIESLSGLKWGAAASTTAPTMIENLIDPEDPLLLYDDSADVVEAMKANQIDASLFDLPTALYLSAVTLDDGVLVGQFPPALSENPDQFGLVLAEGSPLKTCVDAAITALEQDGTLAALESEWLAGATGVPVID
ncbi:ABC transporter substrate-binding protein [Salibaculum halophilum]|uniref:ABC transporter substrate-binding protein n=1 Tax=Salibaculum halophilum TaxID=1914408 RepID=UPI000A0FF374|nr:ABC transporter substrate-binding protein [Salibaculum halophilum]